MILFVFVSDKLSLVLDDKYREAVINLSLLFCVSVGWIFSNATWLHRHFDFCKQYVLLP